MNRVKGTPGFIAVLVVCLCGMYFAAGLGGSEPQAAAAPERTFQDSGVFEPGDAVDDGYNRLLVDVPPEPEVAEREPAAGSEFLTEEGIDLGVLDGQDDVAVIENEDGEMVANYPDGSSIVLTADEIEEDGGPRIEEVIAELEADPAVAEVRRIDDQTIAVTTTREADEIATMVGLAVTPDEPTMAFETDPYFGYQWGLENTAQASGYVEDADIDAPDAWSTSSRGSGVLVAVLDTGVDFGHPDLGARRWTNTDENCSNGVDDDNNGYVDDCNGWDFVYNDASPWDGNNNFHGTHVAGIVAASSDSTGVVGVAANATIMDVRILDSQGRGYTSAFAAAIRYAVDNGAQVINMSVGTNPGVPRQYLAPVETAVQYARDHGVIIVAAAGNSNVDVDTQFVWPASFGRYYANVATIAATDYADSRSSFSNYGAETVLVGAPGSRILSTTINNEWAYASGTSMAAPMFAGAAALLYGDGLASTPTQVIDRLVTSADPVATLDGRARNASRINIGNLYSNAVIDPVKIEAVGLHSLQQGSAIDASLNIKVNDVEGFAAQEFHWEARLLTAVDGKAHGVFEHPVTVNGVDTLTNQQALFALSGDTSLIADPSPVTQGSRIDLGTSLPEGSYALMVEAVAADDPTMILAPPAMLFFEVGPEPPTPTTTSSSSTEAPATTEPGEVTTSTTEASSPTTVAGGPSTTIDDGDDSDRGNGDRGPGRDNGKRPPGITPSSTIPDIPDKGPKRGDDGDEDDGSDDDDEWDWSPTTSTTTAPGVSTTTSTTVPGTTSSTTPGVSTTVPGTTSTTEFGSTPTTSVSTTTSAPTSSSVVPTTALSTTTSEAGPTTTTTQPNRNGVWEITAIAPSSAPVGVGGGYTGISGLFPAVPRVFFGNVEVEPTVASSTYLLVPIPIGSEPGAVDISLRIDSSIVLVMEDAFTYTGSAVTTTTAPGQDPGDGGDGGGGSPGDSTTTTTPAGGGDPGTPDGPGDITTTTQAGSTPTTIGGGSPTTTIGDGPSPTTQPGSSTSTTVPGSPTTTQPGSGNEPGGDGPGGDNPNDGGPTTTSTTIGNGPTPSTTTTTAPAPSGERGQRPSFGFGSAFVTEGGLTVAPVEQPSAPTGDIPTIDWPSVACTPATCSSRSM